MANVLFSVALLLAAPTAQSASLRFQHGDVIAFLGGADVAAAQHTGHQEALIAAPHRQLGLRFRNLGWEGDTVSTQPRDVGFPPLETRLAHAEATVIVLQFGRAEALAGRGAMASFVRD